ncbi:MAG: F0F1 ATP synthase subunit epsilon [Candidatus Latescibacteria bacterium]|nr:F0F1 ATP synthase subunit epsilon [Candidatus Latescibacterota bacterium]
MPPTFQLEIVTPEKTVYSGEVERLRAPGTEGGFGVLAGHHPMLAALAIGQMVFSEQEQGPQSVAISGGFAEVQRDRVTVLAETAEFAQEIDVTRAEVARDRARERLARKRDQQVDEARARLALVRAINRLRTGG